MNPGDNKTASKPSTIRARLKHPDEDTFIKKYAANVTRSELFLKTAKPKPVGAQVRFEIQIASGDIMLRGIGEVAWSRTESKAGEPAGMGIKFKKLDAKTKQVISSMLAYKKKRSSAATDEKPTGHTPASKERDGKPVRTKKVARKSGALDDELTKVSSSVEAKKKRRVERTRPAAELDLDDVAKPRTRRGASERSLDEDLGELPRRRETAEEREKAREKRRKEREEEREKRREARRKARAAEKAARQQEDKEEVTRPDYQLDELTGTRAKLEEESESQERASQTEVAPEEAPRPEPAASEPELELDSDEELDIEPDTGEVDIDDMLNTTLVEKSQPEKPLHLDSGYIAIKSLAPDMPQMEALSEEQEDIFEDDEKPPKAVKKADEVEISDDAARLTDFILGGGEVDDNIAGEGSDMAMLIESVDDEDDDDEVILDIDASHVEAEPAGLGDMTTQLDLEDDSSSALLDALASANADNKIGKNRLDNLIDEMTRDSVNPESKDPLLATKDVGAALDEIFVSVDDEEEAAGQDLFGLENAPMELPDDAVPDGLVREQPLPGLYDEPEIPIDTDDSGVEELTEDEDEKGRRVSFFKKLFGG